MRPVHVQPGVAKCHLPVIQEGESRDVSRSRRKRAVRARTLSVKRMTQRDTMIGALLYPDRGERMPATRADCANGERPCPFVSCQHHLYLDVDPYNGSIKLNFPDIEPDEMVESCALDAAARGGMTIEQVGEAMNLTRERVRQIELVAKARIASDAERLR